MPKTVLNTLEQFINSQVAKIEQFVQHQYELDNFKIRVTLNTTKKCSWGGVQRGTPFIELTIQKYISAIESNSNIDFIEYSSFSSDPQIGSVYDVSWQQAVSILIAHEVAHAVQYFNPLKVVKSKYAAHNIKINEFRSHKKLWKLIYSDLRNYILNSPTNTINTSNPVTITNPTSKKKWIVERYMAKGYWVITYKTSTNETLLNVLKKNGKFFIWDRTNKTWIDTKLNNLVSVRNYYIA